MNRNSKIAKIEPIHKIEPIQRDCNSNTAKARVPVNRCLRQEGFLRTTNLRRMRWATSVIWCFLAGVAGLFPNSSPCQEAALADWPALPERNGAVEIPAQEWPLRPGPRRVRVLVHFPGAIRAKVNEQTGLMLTLHNWGGTDCAGTASPTVLADQFNVVALCVNYLQSGPKDSIEGPEPYDYGYLQALDALRALWWLDDGMKKAGIKFDERRVFTTGGSGGGNVSLMANKLAPRTFACVIDMCGMKKLSDDIAYNLPGGVNLDARYNRDPASPNFLTVDDQELRFVGNPDHLQTQRQLLSAASQQRDSATKGNGATSNTPTRLGAKIVVVHGVDDTTYPDALEMVGWLRRAKLDVHPHFVTKDLVDSTIFTTTGHALGNRTKIVAHVAGKWLSPDSPESLRRSGPSDFLLREVVRYRTSNGAFEIDYSAGYPVGRFVRRQAPPDYPNHQDLTFFLEGPGQKKPIATKDDWQRRRDHIAAHFQRVTGPFPSPTRRVALDVKVTEEVRLESANGPLLRRKLTYQSDPNDRVSAYLFLPASKASKTEGEVQEKPVPAVLCLQQTTNVGKDEPAGIRGDASLKYALELAERGYVTLAPDYPSFGEHPYDFAPERGYASGSMKAVWDNVRAIDYLETLPEVDDRRIGCIGHSLGGHNGILTAFFEPRIAALVSSCGFCSLQKDDIPSWTGQRYMPLIASQFKNDGTLIPFDFHELVASLAPRPFFISAATRDDDFDVTGVKDVAEAARPIYSLYGKGDNLVEHYPETGHSFPNDSRLKAYEFLDRALKKAKDD